MPDLVATPKPNGGATKLKKASYQAHCFVGQRKAKQLPVNTLYSEDEELLIANEDIAIWWKEYFKTDHSLSVQGMRFKWFFQSEISEKL